VDEGHRLKNDKSALSIAFNLIDTTRRVVDIAPISLNIQNNNVVSVISIHFVLLGSDWHTTPE